MNSKLNTAAIAWLKNTEWELAITVTFKASCSERRARKTMSRWLNELDKKFMAMVLGKKTRDLNELL